MTPQERLNQSVDLRYQPEPLDNYDIGQNAANNPQAYVQDAIKKTPVQTIDQIVAPIAAKGQTGVTNQYTDPTNANYVAPVAPLTPIQQGIQNATNPLYNIETLGADQTQGLLGKIGSRLQQNASQVYGAGNQRAMDNYNTLTGVAPSFDNRPYNDLVQKYLGQNAVDTSSLNASKQALGERYNYYRDRFQNLTENLGQEGTFAKYLMNRSLIKPIGQQLQQIQAGQIDLTKQDNDNVSNMRARLQASALAGLDKKAADEYKTKSALVENLATNISNNSANQTTNDARIQNALSDEILKQDPNKTLNALTLQEKIAEGIQAKKDADEGKNYASGLKKQAFDVIQRDVNNKYNPAYREALAYKQKSSKDDDGTTRIDHVSETTGSVIPASAWANQAKEKLENYLKESAKNGSITELQKKKDLGLLSVIKSAEADPFEIAELYRKSQGDANAFKNYLALKKIKAETMDSGKK